MKVWIAYYSDWSGFALFDTEIDALRFAVGSQMQVQALNLPCEDVRKTVEAKR